MAPIEVENDSVPVNDVVHPKWLNEEYFADILKKQFGKFEITKFNVQNALSKGENYASVMSRVKIDVKNKDNVIESISYLVKSTIQSELANQMVGDMSLFEKEIDMYDKIVPQIEKLFKESGTDVCIGAKCVKTQKNPPAIVMQDLKVNHYENINRLNGMDLEHIEETLKKLAQFHAATARIHQVSGPFPSHFYKGMFPPEMEPMMTAMFEQMWPILEESILKWGDCEKYLKKIKKNTSEMLKLLIAAEAIDPTEFNVLNHGDMWANNIMFQHNEDGSVKDVKFVDLQICRWGSPAQDLQYLIISSCSDDIRIEKFDYLIKFYHDHLIKNLKLVQYSGKMPTLMELHVNILKRGYFSINTAFGVLSVVLLESTENADMENFLAESEKGTEFKRQLFSNPRYVKTMKALLPFFDNRGLLDA